MLGRWIAVFVFSGLVAVVLVLDRASRGDFDARESEFAFELVESSAAAGIDFEHRAAALDPKIDHVAPHIMGVGAAAAVIDFDGDGKLDVYLTNSDFGAPCALLRGRGDGTFEDVAERAGLADMNRPGQGVCMGSVWGDIDNDGDPDAMIFRYGQTSLFRNEGDGSFRDISQAAGLAHWINSNAACWFDYDRDGLLDLLVAGYFAQEHDLWNVKTTRVMHDSGQFAENGGLNRLFRNLGPDSDGVPQFTEVTDQAGLTSTRWTFAVSAADLDGDGWQDLYVANDYNEEECLLNRADESGLRHFEAIDAGFDHHSKSGMSITFGNVRNDGRMAIFVTNISSAGWILHGNNLRLNHIKETGYLVEQAAGALIDTGWAWGAQFGDLDNDGFQDIVVANGFISADPDRQYWYEASKLASGSGEILSDAAQWPPFAGRSQSGYERTRVLLNRNGRRFVEVGEQVGVSDTLDGRAIVLFDANDDGRLDMLIANQKGPTLLYRNHATAGHEPGAWLALTFEGTHSNRDGFGASARVEFGDQTQVQVLCSSAGFSSQPGPRLHFGLGQHSGPVRAEITWPSGRVQVLDELETGRIHHLIEPAAEHPAE